MLNFERMTRVKDNWPCRINECMAEEWMRDLYGEYSEESICENCPFEDIVNRLAELEDYLETIEDDGK